VTALAGFWTFGSRHDPQRSCGAMLKAQAVYGPHGSAQSSAGPIALGRSLFRTLPEDRHDKGPVVSTDGRLTLIADLRLDNRSELLRMLDLPERQATDLADAALLMRALERWREGAIERLIGCFALALWDSGREELLLARDYLGQRPLYFHRGPDFLALASMAKGLHCLSEIPFGANPARAIDLLAFRPGNGRETFYDAIDRVEPGHVVTVRRDAISSRRYWTPDLSPLQFTDSREYEEGLRDHLDAAVRAQLRGAEAKVGSHLSAGLDSAAVTATAARQLGPNGTLFAFTAVPRAGFDSPVAAIIDEGPLAAATAALYPNINHRRVRGDGRSPLAALDRDFFLFEQPTVALCNGVWNNAINDAAREEGVGVMLSGLTGNLGLSHDGFDALPMFLARGRIATLAKTSWALRRNGVRWATLGSATLGPFLPSRARRLIDRLRGHDAGSFAALRGDTLERHGTRLAGRPEGERLPAGLKARLGAISRFDVGNFNKGTLAGWGIDHRDPTADRRLIEYCLRVPSEECLAGGMPRSLARRAFADRLPPVVTGEMRRGYQSADWHEGLAAARPEIEAELKRISACRDASQILDVARMRSLVDHWPSEGWDRRQTERDYRHLLLRSLAAGHFLRRCSGSNG
jgi:asparagine synthase (glutamine-hydrolysing)